jgi:hypothetical protein
LCPNCDARVHYGADGEKFNGHPHGAGRDAWLQVGVDWDNGRTLMLTVPPDEYEI